MYLEKDVMTYIVIFNYDHVTPDPMTDGHGFLQSFLTFEAAEHEALGWLDGLEFKNFKIYKECSQENE